MFRLRKDARVWFKGIESTLNLDFDMYYICLMAGLTMPRKETIPSSETTDLTQVWPGEYKIRSRTILALFLTKEINDLGINLNEKKAVNDAIKNLIDPMSPAFLNENGFKEMNKYSFGGFEVLSEWFDTRPRSIETFLPRLKKKISSSV